MKATFKTLDYRFVHGKEPRGTGRWLFAECSERHDTTKFISVFGTYSDAKKKVARLLREQGLKYPVIVVMP